MRELFNLVVDLSVDFAAFRNAARDDALQIVPSAAADERTLAWIDDAFGGAWSSEAHAGTNVLAFRDEAPVGFATFDPKGLRFAWLRGLARERDVGIFGPFGVSESERGRGLGTALLHLALTGLRERGYARALIAAVGDAGTIGYYSNAVGAQVAERFDGKAWVQRRPRVTVMVSGSGTNLQSVLDRAAGGDLPIDVTAVVSNNPRAYALERARRAGVPSVRVVRWKRGEESREAYDLRLLDEVRADSPDLIVMLGWMHLLSESFVRAFPSLVNLHPAFLPLDPERDDVVMPDGTRMPAYRGPDAVGDALADKRLWVGATVHAVTPATDRGPVLVRKPLHVAPDETHDSVMERLHLMEHGLVAAAIRRWIYERK
jgi:phosphoribosylglycinamide formyltransferase-1